MASNNVEGIKWRLRNVRQDSTLDDMWRCVILELKDLRHELTALQAENAALREKLENKFDRPLEGQVVISFPQED